MIEYIAQGDVDRVRVLYVTYVCYCMYIQGRFEPIVEEEEEEESIFSHVIPLSFIKYNI